MAHAGSRSADPQSGPALSTGVRGFFHYNARWIVAEEGSIAGLGTSNYINRIGAFAKASGKHPLGRDGERSSHGAGLATSDYINRAEGASDGELGAHVLITRGLPVDTGAALARLLDARERKKDRTYRCYGGRLPRVGTHMILSFRYGLSAEAAGRAAWEHARFLSDRLNVPLEGRVHNVNGAPDHLHLHVGTRIVDRGKLGRKCRELDAVSEKHDGKRLLEGLLGPTIEALRADWAERMRQASGDMAVDHRSYARRGLAIRPVAHVTRSEIEWQKRRARADWRRERDLELHRRAAALGAEITGRSRASTVTAAAEPARGMRRSTPDAVPAVPGVEPGSEKAVSPRSPAPGRRSAQDGDGGASHGRPARRVDPDRDAPTPKIDAAPVIAVHRALRATHRLKADREQALAGMAGIEVEALRRASTEGVGGEAQVPQADPPMSAELARWVAIWRDEDANARAERRRSRDGRNEAAASSSFTPARPSPTRSPAGVVDWLPDIATTRFVRPQHGGSLSPHRDRPTIPSAPAPDVHAGPRAVAKSDTLARALWQAHAGRILTRDRDKGLSRPSDDELSRQVALRLHAGGYDRHETGRVLRAGRATSGLSGDVAIEGALDRAFSPSATAWLYERPEHRAHVKGVSDRAEMAAYRQIRSAALAQLKRDLDDVWRTRHAEVDRVMARHRADMAALRDLRWRNRRLQNRGLVLAILSVMVELAVIRPLMAVETALTSQERRALDDAARVATERLRSLREEWQTARDIVRAPLARRDGRGTLADGPTRGPASVAGSVRSVTPQAQAEARTPRAEAGAATSADHTTLPDVRLPASAGSTGAPTKARKRRAREPAGQAGRGATDRPRRRGRILSSLESRLERARQRPEDASGGSLAKAAGWSALIRTIVADEPDPGRQDVAIQRLVRTLATDHPKPHGGIRAPRARLLPEPMMVADVEPNDGVTASPRETIVATGSFAITAPSPRETEGQKVDAGPPRTAVAHTGAAQVASGPPRPPVPVQTRPAPSPREGEGGPPNGSRTGKLDVAAVRPPPGSATAAAPPSRTAQQAMVPGPVSSAAHSVEVPPSVDRPLASSDGLAGSRDKGEDLRHEPDAQVRRRLVVQYAVVLAASGALSRNRGERLAELAQVDPQNLKRLISEECFTCFGQRSPVRIDRVDMSSRVEAVLREAENMGFSALPDLRNAFIRETTRSRGERGGRDDTGGRGE